jgi:cystathionine beta-synthase
VKCNNILEAMGNTPLIRLNKLAKDLPATVWVKADYMNPGGSVKDRIGVSMIDEAERTGKLKPGGTIIEGTSGNTGMGLALVACADTKSFSRSTTSNRAKRSIC